jgi:hypothetical protein
MRQLNQVPDRGAACFRGATDTVLRRAIAGAGASALVVGALFAGPSIAMANDAEAPTLQEQTTETLQGEVDNSAEAASEVVSDDAREGESPEVPSESALKTQIDEPRVETAAEEAGPAEEDEQADATFDRVYIVQASQYQGGAVDVAYQLAIPDAVTEGDTVQLTFEAPLEYDDSVRPVLRDDQGEIVATGELTDAENRVITFTFTDYVDKNKNVKISGSFAMIANDPSLDGNLEGQSTHHELAFTQGETIFTDTLEIMPHSRTPLTKVFNYGVWTGEDKGHEMPENAVLWTANSPEGEWEGMTVTLNPATGSNGQSTSSFDCTTLTFYTQEVPDGGLYHHTAYDNDEQRTLSGTIDERPSFVSDVQCDADQVQVTYTGHIADNFLRQFTIEASVNDRDQIGHFGSVVRATGIAASEGAVECPDPIWGGEYVDFASACDLSETHWYNFVARDAAVGGGEGENRDASIDLEKYSTADGPVEGDFDTTPGKALEKGSTEHITFEITNTGEETLTDITLVDTTIVGAELAMVSCDLEGVTLAAGESVTCEGAVTVAKPGQHGDSATVTAIARGGGQVTDTDTWWGTVAPDPVVPPETPETPDKPEKPDAPKNTDRLVTTGGDDLWLAAGFATLLVIGGGAAFGIARGRRVKQS